MNANAAITFSGSGTNTFTGAFNGGASAINMNSTGVVQNLNGTINFTGPITVSNGTLGFSPTADTTLGGGAINVGTAQGNVGTLTIGPHAMLTTSALTVGANNGSNGNGTLIQTGGTISATGTVNLGNNGGIGTLNLSGGTIKWGRLNMATNGNGNNCRLFRHHYDWRRRAGQCDQRQYRHGAILQSAGNDHAQRRQPDAGDPTRLGRLTPRAWCGFRTTTPRTWARIHYNLNGGVFTAGGMEISVTADSSGTGNFNLNRPADRQFQRRHTARRQRQLPLSLIRRAPARCRRHDCRRWKSVRHQRARRRRHDRHQRP